MVQMSLANVPLLFMTLETGWQYAVMVMPDGLFYLVVVGSPVFAH